ncbi:amidohydrolase family protein [Streptomyces shenzhenensis]|uniref:amidohydrolase family protein n=1 Tax=Streptomyces shenzhenensis TaxID=943815 RepID=UPI0015F09699|nr:amidohydrolase family protein [Streptomyces shenzhenensis]
MIIDSHQHVWDLDRAPYPWLGPHVPQWNRTFTFEEVQPDLRRNGVSATVMVQAADNDQDTQYMLAVADDHPEVVGVVGYVPLEKPAEASARLAELRTDRRVVGIRNLTHDRPDPDWILRPDVDEGLSVLEAAGIPFDYVAVIPRHLEHVPVLSERHPRLRIVVDHLAKPPIGRSGVEPWWSLMAAAAENPLVHAKVSGLYPGEAPDRWNADAIRPFVERAVELFGPSRLMYGGDWPISVAAGGYSRVFEGVMQALRGVAPRDRDEILSGTARRFYDLDDDLLTAAAARSRGAGRP